MEKTASRLTFRGPDATCVWSEEGASFCFTLLRTGPAPQASAQPVTLDQRTWLLGHVRLDERDELIRELRGLGKQCGQTTTDEELVLLAWKLWEEREEREEQRRFREALRGEFSFVLWCAEQRRLHCFRDLMGSRPFFFSRKGDLLCFSNTLEVLLDTPGVSDELDVRYVGDFLLASWCADPERTPYRDIQRLPAGHELTFSRDGLQVKRFDQLPIEEPLILKRPAEYVEQYRGVLRKAVEERLPKEGAGVFLSGGLDSPTVAATAVRILRSENSGGTLYAHTLDYQPLFDDREGEYAEKVAGHLGIPIEISHCGDREPFFGWDDPRAALPEPKNDPYLLLSALRSRLAARHARVVLSGDGGDDILGGKSWNYLKHLLRRLQLGTILKSFGGYVLKHGKIPPLGAGIQTRLRRWFGGPEEIESYPAWLNPEFEGACNLRSRWDELHLKPKLVHPLHRRAYWGLSGSYWPNLLEQEDAAWTGTATEYRAPMLDGRVLRFLLRIPPVPWCMNKELLRVNAVGLLPEEIRRRPKTPVQEEPLLLHISKQGWSPLSLASPSPKIFDFVDWKRWSSTLTRLEAHSVWAQLCPLSLNLWLKHIEMRKVIR